MSRINNVLRRFYNKIQRKKLKNKDLTLFCNNCTGAFILHDLGVKFNSPCVNLFIYEEDYVKFISNLDYYKLQELEFIETKEKYPVAKLDDITVYFMHYESKEEAKTKWTERFERVNKDNMFFMLHQREKCTDKALEAFDRLPYKNKVALTCKPYPNLGSYYCIANHETDGYLDHLYLFKSPFSWKKYYDDFDYVTWFNTGIVK